MNSIIDSPVLYLYCACMTAVATAKRILAEAEKRLRALIAEELKSGNYVDVAEIAVLADRLVTLANGQGAQGGVAAPGPQLAVGASLADVKRKTGRKYPRFERDDRRLIKVGWSKKGRKEYEHRVPIDGAEAFVRHLQANVNEGDTFAMEDLLPVPDLTSGGDVPSYQGYVTLAWLRDLGVVARKGRDGYVLRARFQADQLRAYWNSLPVRSQ